MNNKKTNTTLSAIAARFTALFLILTMASCTLSMEDWVETEENKGYDELVTDENEFYSVKYQYKDYTRSITDQIREYIVSVEADSVIYFLDNLPEEWIPQVGGCVVSNCCTTFPMGLVARVLDVQKEAGMIKVTTTPCELEDAYEDFQLDMDMDVLSSKNPQMKSITRSAYPKTRGEEGPDSIISTIDWTMFNRTSKKEKVKCIDGNITRADEEDYFEQDFDRDETKVNETPIVTFDESCKPLGYLVEKMPFIDQAEIELSYVSEVHIKKEVRLSEKYEHSLQVEQSGLKVAVAVGSKDALEVECTDKAKEKIAERFEAFASNINKIGSFKDNERIRDDLAAVDDAALVVQIPLGTLPFGVIIKAEPILDVEAILVGNAELTFWLSKTQTEATIINGDKKEEKPLSLKPDRPELDCSLGGELNVSLGGEVFFGLGRKIGVGKASAFGVGGFVAYTTDLEIAMKYDVGLGYIKGSNDSGISLSGKIEYGCKALGGMFGEFTFLKDEKTVWEGLDLKFYPEVEVKKDISLINHEDEERRFKQFELSYCYKNLGFYATMLNSFYHPGIRLFMGKEIENNNDYIDLEPDNKPAFVERGKQYTFSFKTDDVKQDYTAVPILIYKNNNYKSYTLFTDNKRYIGDESVPIIEYKPDYSYTKKKYNIVFQQWGDELDDDAPELSELVTEPGVKYYSYEVCLPFFIYNAPSMKSAWSDFGIKYTVSFRGNKQVYYRSLYNKIKKSKLYVPRITIIADEQIESGSKDTYVYAQLYYKDKEHNYEHFFNKQEDWKYCYQKYADSDVPGAEMIVDNKVLIVSPFSSGTFYDWELDNDAYINIK